MRAAWISAVAQEAGLDRRTGPDLRELLKVIVVDRIEVDDGQDVLWAFYVGVLRKSGSVLQVYSKWALRPAVQWMLFLWGGRVFYLVGTRRVVSKGFHVMFG